MGDPAIASFELRQLRAPDAEAFRALRLAGLINAPTAFGASPAQEVARPIETVRALLDAAPNAVFGAFVEGRLVGLAGFFRHDGDKARHRGQLWGVYVDPAVRGRGVARRLVEAVIDHARRHVAILEAAVSVGNDHAGALYSVLGFEAYARHPAALMVEGAFIDEILLRLDFRA
ncbi:Protein N-acetyltransferase, RimJ/RimL family [Kaistia soli DSM 19436]|uniref:Protein N-acetyltransferase, RimJ/RimL family n=1 Tax=Kaistia soli DSM 19436 TaxID=1122133 RepID=A0A1M5M590_9HYPH|nr:GNAT family N-acetyltransferase [Kaistia soli]SHG72089.1 Protein N-acetyltransferase, RimJ/RimL family [Kaistia soli DSM 19436]